MANIEIIKGHWRFYTNVNLVSFYEEMEYIAEIINKTEEQCISSKVLAHYHSNNNNENFCDGLTIQLTNELEEMNELNKYFLHRRQKRGQMDVVGHGMKFLFGSMDAYDAKLYEKRFRMLSSKGQRTESNLKQQKSFLQSTISKLNETDEILNEHTSLLKNLNDEIDILQQNNINEHNYNQANSMFTQLINYASILINKIRRDQTKLFDIM